MERLSVTASQREEEGWKDKANADLILQEKMEHWVHKVGLWCI